MGDISTADMVADCKQRLPLRVTSTFWINRLNEAYRWICQQGAFPWTLTQGGIVVGTDGTFGVPTDWSPGRPSYIYHSDGLMIPQKSWEEALKHNVYASEIAQRGNYSCWTYSVNLAGDEPYMGHMFPESSHPLGLDNSPFIVYHRMTMTPLSETGATYFPTPPEFDELLVSLAEAEGRRRYGVAGWEKIQTRSQASIQNLLKTYITDKHTQFGLENTARHAQESQAAKAV